MRNHRGQALIEFLLILPVLFMIMMAVFDFGNILYHQYKMENKLDFIVDLYRNDQEEELEQYLQENDLVMDVAQESAYATLYIKQEIHIYTPGLSKILGSPYRIDATKTVYEG